MTSHYDPLNGIQKYFTSISEAIPANTATAIPPRNAFKPIARMVEIFTFSPIPAKAQASRKVMIGDR